jgi:putative nucleotidyltransferase with HDIG domain
MWTISDNKSWEYLEQQFDWVKVMREIPQDSIHHAEGNVDVHTRMVLAALEQDSFYQSLDLQDQETLWAAALLHDVEKRSTTVTEPDGRITSKGHARKGAQTARVILYRDIPAPFRIRERIYGLVKHHSLPLWLLERRDPLKTVITASLEVNTEWLALLARADVLGRVSDDQANLLHRIESFSDFCREHGCWGIAHPFASGSARLHYLRKEGVDPDHVPVETPETTVVLMSGLPGAGKGAFIRKNFPDMPVISPGRIRQELQTGNEPAMQAAKERALECLRKKKSFVWNATNITRQMRSELINLFLAHKARIRIVYVETPYAQLHHPFKTATALEKLVRKLEVPAVWEAHTVDYFYN